MGIGQLTKQIGAVKDVVDSLRPSETVTAEPRDPGSIMIGQLQAMQKALKEEEELVVTCTAGGQSIRVFEVFLPSPQVAVLSGVDNDRNTTRIIAPVETLQLVCKPRTVPPPAKANRLKFVMPKPA